MCRVLRIDSYGWHRQLRWYPTGIRQKEYRQQTRPEKFTNIGKTRQKRDSCLCHDDRLNLYTLQSIEIPQCKPKGLHEIFPHGPNKTRLEAIWWGSRGIQRHQLNMKMIQKMTHWIPLSYTLKQPFQPKAKTETESNTCQLIKCGHWLLSTVDLLHIMKDCEKG